MTTPSRPPPFPRMTVAVLRILRIFLEEPDQPCYGYQIVKITGYAHGLVYPALARLYHHGWIYREPEGVDPKVVGRRERQFYSLTPEGKQWALEATAKAREELLT